MKTVLAPGAPWPDVTPVVKTKAKPKAKAKPHAKKKPFVPKHVRVHRGELDFFKEAREAIAIAQARKEARKNKV